MRRLILGAAAVAGAVAIAAPINALPKGTEEFNDNRTAVGECSADGYEMVLTAPAKLWPPNHKYFEGLGILASSPDDTEQVTLETDGTHDQYVDGAEQNGAGNTASDITVDDEDAQLTTAEDDPQPAAVESGTGSVLTNWKVRAERSGRDQTGRVYTLHGLAEFASGETCEGTITITVPHDMRRENR